MTSEERFDRLLVKQRAKFWEELPTRAVRIGRLARKERAAGLELGEREELELTVQRIAESAGRLGFDDVCGVASEMSELLWMARAGGEVGRRFEECCDHLVEIIDDMTLEVLAVGLRSLWNGD